MKINNAKEVIYDFFNEEIKVKYPQVSVFWRGTRQNTPEYPYIMLNADVKVINKRFDVRKEVRLTVTFGAYASPNSENLEDSDNITTELVEYIQNLFGITQKTFDALYKKEITVNELLASDIRDLSSFSQTNQEFRKEIDIVFEFEDVIESSEAESALGLDIDIKVDNTDRKIEMEVNNVNL